MQKLQIHATDFSLPGYFQLAFFFFKQKTAYEIVDCDWSSDVCSSDLVAVDTADITGDRVVVPTYFVVDDPEEGQKALHHVDDAEEISDVIRQARVNEEGERTWR